MSDIVERLRDIEQCIDACDDAADEIDSLRAELAQAQANAWRMAVISDQQERIIEQHRRAARNVADFTRYLWAIYNDACDDAGRTVEMNQKLIARAEAAEREVRAWHDAAEKLSRELASAAQDRDAAEIERDEAKSHYVDLLAEYDALVFQTHNLEAQFTALRAACAKLTKLLASEIGTVALPEGAEDETFEDAVIRYANELAALLPGWAKENGR